jgi:hypothetical protein
MRRYGAKFRTKSTRMPMVLHVWFESAGRRSLSVPVPLWLHSPGLQLAGPGQLSHWRSVEQYDLSSAGSLDHSPPIHVFQVHKWELDRVRPSRKFTKTLIDFQFASMDWSRIESAHGVCITRPSNRTASIPSMQVARSTKGRVLGPSIISQHSEWDPGTVLCTTCASETSYWLCDAVQSSTSMWLMAGVPRPKVPTVR